MMKNNRKRNDRPGKRRVRRYNKNGIRMDNDRPPKYKSRRRDGDDE